MLQQALPKDSIFHLWLDARSIVETPISYDLVCVLSALGVAMRRNAWVDQVEWKVYPGMSVLLVGPSGVGKNTAIGGAEKILQHLQCRVIGGKTIETITDQLQKCGNPAVAAMFAEELSDFIGKKDYQQGLLQGLTELLETKVSKDISLKSDAQPRKIMQPTLTMFAGSTAEWLHKAMPPEAMNGGFYPRFVIACEEQVKRHVPLVKALPSKELLFADAARSEFYRRLELVVVEQRDCGEFGWEPAAQTMYEEWYERRHQSFSVVASAYAHRARDHALRAAMLCALSRSKRVIDELDVGFGVALMEHIAASVDSALAAQSPESEVSKKILALLPCNEALIYREMSKMYPLRVIREAFGLLHVTQQISSAGSLVCRTED